MLCRERSCCLDADNTLAFSICGGTVHRPPLPLPLSSSRCLGCIIPTWFLWSCWFLCLGIGLRFAFVPVCLSVSLPACRKGRKKEKHNCCAVMPCNKSVETIKRQATKATPLPHVFLSCRVPSFYRFNSSFRPPLAPPQVLTPHDYILPDGWIVAHSRREKRDYFFNQRTNSTQWHPPDGSRPR